MNDLFQTKSIFQELKETVRRDVWKPKTSNSFLTPVDTHKFDDVVMVDAFCKLCDYMDITINQINNINIPKENKIRDASSNNKKYLTYEEHRDELNKANGIGYCGLPCAPGTRVILLNTNTHELIVTKFDPKMTTDWKIVYNESSLSSNEEKLSRILYNLGWYDVEE